MMYPLPLNMLIAPYAIAAALAAITAAAGLPGALGLAKDAGCLLLAAAGGAASGTKHVVQRQLHKARRRRTARALHALRHDREYLLGRLPPMVSAQVLSHLDPASLSALRRACRQSCLLVSWGASRLQLGLAAAAHYSQVPLDAVWPQLQVLSLAIDPTSDSHSLWLRPPDGRKQGSRRTAGDAQNMDSTYSTSGAQGGSLVADPTADSLVADAAVRALMEQPGGLHGLAQLRVLDLTHCTISLTPHTWHALAAALPDGCTVLTPLRALQDPRRTAYASQRCSAAQVVPALRAFAAGSAAGGGSRTRDTPRVFLELLGAGLEVSSPQALYELVSSVLPGQLITVSLLDAWTYAGTMDWTPLGSSDGAGAGLQELRAVAGSEQSLTKLLLVLPHLPSLSNLCLGSMGAQWPVGQPARGSVVGPPELTLLATLPNLTRLECHNLRLPSSQAVKVGESAPLPQLRALSACVVEGTDSVAAPTLFATLFPSLTSLALGLCPRAAAAAAAGLGLSECEAKDSAEVGAAAVARLSEGPHGELAALRAPPLLPQLQGLKGLSELSLSGLPVMQLALELTNGTMHASLALPALTTLHLHHVPSYEQLCNILRLLVHLPRLHTLGLHHACTRGAAKHVPSGPAAAQQPAIPIGLLGGLPGVLGAGQGAGHQGFGQGGGGGWDVDEAGGFGPVDAASKICGARRLRHLTLRGGDLRLAQHVCAQPAHFSQLTLTLSPMITEEEVAGAIHARRASSGRSGYGDAHRQSLDVRSDGGSRALHGQTQAAGADRVHHVTPHSPLACICIHGCRLVSTEGLEGQGTDLVTVDWGAVNRTLARSS